MAWWPSGRSRVLRPSVDFGCLMWTDSNHPGGWGRRYTLDDRRVPSLRCWAFGPLRYPDWSAGRLCWTSTLTGRVLGSVSWCLQPGASGRGVAFSWQDQGGSIHTETVAMAPEGNVAAGPGVRWWWACPACGRRCGVVFVLPDHRIACRTCGGVQFASRLREHPAQLDRRLRKRLGNWMLG